MHSFASIKTCWIAWVKRELGLTRGRAPNNLGNIVPPPPPAVRQAIRDFIEEFRAQQGRVPTYKEIQRGAFLKLKFPSPETDPFLQVENWALETGIPDLAREHHRYIEEDS